MLKQVFTNKNLLKSKYFRVKPIQSYAIANLYQINQSNDVEIEIYLPNRVETYVTMVDKSQIGLYSPESL